MSLWNLMQGVNRMISNRKKKGIRLEKKKGSGSSTGRHRKTYKRMAWADILFHLSHGDLMGRKGGKWLLDGQAGSARVIGNGLGGGKY